MTTRADQSDRSSEPEADGILYRVTPSVSNDDLNTLFAASWPGFHPRDFQPVLARSLAYVCAFEGPRLVGFVNVAWDGGLHGFVLDTTVQPDRRRRGIGRRLVRIAAEVARARGLEWLHVDYEPRLEQFYRDCGFTPTAAGLLHLPSLSDAADPTGPA